MNEQLTLQQVEERLNFFCERFYEQNNDLSQEHADKLLIEVLKLKLQYALAGNINANIIIDTL